MQNITNAVTVIEPLFLAVVAKETESSFFFASEHEESQIDLYDGEKNSPSA